MFDRLRLAWDAFWSEFWSGEDHVTLYANARNVALARLAAEPVPQPDLKLMQRIIEGRHHKLGTVERIRRSGW